MTRGDASAARGSLFRPWVVEFTLASPLPCDVALGAVKRLLESESVRVEVRADRIDSTETPLCLTGWDARQYTRRNAIGWNPFAFVDRVTIAGARADDGGSRLLIRTVCLRGLLLFGLFAIFASIVATIHYPFLWGKGAIPAAIVFVSYYFIFRLPAKLAKKEIAAALAKTPPPQAG